MIHFKKSRLLQIFFLIFISSFASAQNQFSVFFDSNKYDLKTSEFQRLNNWILSNKEIKIVGVNGFCDEDGTTIINDTLARKRINYIFNIIKTKLKIRDDFKTRSFGELHQQSKIKAENRKVTLYYLEQKDLARENEILGIKSQEVTPMKSIEINFPDKISLNNPDGTTTEIALDIAFMKQINTSKTGEKLNIENLNFHFNTFAVLNESRAKLYELLIVLEQNPKLKIEIQGHICCNTSTKEMLSAQRAKAVYNFLVINKISKSRLTYKGFGSTQPIFAIPEKSEHERATNRRVEILILEN